MPSIGILGGGLSGLVAAKTFLEEGFDVTVFEKEDEVGGVWARSRRYPGLITQNTRDTYAFSDFPMPRCYPEWPTGEQMQAYLTAYADHFGVTKRLRLRTQVDEVRRRGERGFVMVTRRADDPAAPRETHGFDFVVICSGVASIPHVPELPGREAFASAGGIAIHSTGFHDTALVAGRRVVVLGFAKSACDAAVAAVGSAREVTLVYRRPVWKVPHFLFGAVNIKYALANRLLEVFFAYPYATGFERALHTTGRPLVAMYWRGVEWSLESTLKLRSAGMLPEQPLQWTLGCNFSVASEWLYQHLRAGRIRGRRGEITRFVEGGVELSDGGRVDADVVIFGTGFRQEVPFLEESLRRVMVDENGTFHLHRNLVHPDAPGLGFCGFVSSLYSQLTSEIGARWLSRYFKGELRLPPRDEALAEIEQRLAWRLRQFPEGFFSGTCVAPFSFHYIDDLLRDMGARSRRLPWNPLREFLLPMDPSLYADLKAELDRNRAARGARV